MNAEEVKARLVEGLPDCEVTVEFDGYYFNIVAVGEVFQGLRKVQRQQKVLGVLHDLITSGEIHAVKEVQTYTPDEKP
ncbi:BolA/IbaG family iron-sulfur metabolism protein [Porticoccus litoralis]|jgi:acid stress-induced BolA-like protein IbaG/YrbA|uniref:BolA/IbaG family iron-sulfur metabolism protein n=1 Tax=Porticoccus litoralis TaxID=434086 RepID=A0AAW8B052_9GAMM|nr:BolA/IbaG family iron-sulfur metabolism protein [Porticoccus litoralis]MDP1520065.1 BolA/IbaG family iron-sulfur metabolism protein [Porticoccus litoralis]